ncbi:hypothetical protein AB0M58_14500 [Streptomyces bobili]|uniref:hypothetical protein n=1 Tax=Streptomyces bobili TaxID=67280 RepID=UPI00343B0808
MEINPEFALNNDQLARLERLRAKRESDPLSQQLAAMDAAFAASANKDDTRAQENHELRRLVTIYEAIIAGVINGDITVDVLRGARTDV